MKKSIIFTAILGVCLCLGFFSGCNSSAETTLVGKWVPQNEDSINGFAYKRCLEFFAGGAVVWRGSVFCPFRQQVAGQYPVGGWEADLPFGYVYGCASGEGRWALKNGDLSLSVHQSLDGIEGTFHITIRGDEMIIEPLTGDTKTTYHRVKEWPWLTNSVLAPYKLQPSVAKAIAGKWIFQPSPNFKHFIAYMIQENGDGVSFHSLFPNSEGAADDPDPLMPHGWHAYSQARPAKIHVSSEGAVITIVGEASGPETYVVEVKGNAITLRTRSGDPTVFTRVNKFPWE